MSEETIIVSMCDFEASQVSITIRYRDKRIAFFENSNHGFLEYVVIRSPNFSIVSELWDFEF